MNFFTKNLTKSNKEIKQSRATRIAEQAKMAQEDLVRTMTKQMFDLDAQLDDLEDLSPDSMLSLNVTSGDFNAEEWTKKIQEVNIQKLNLGMEITIAKQTFNKYFSDEPKETK